MVHEDQHHGMAATRPGPMVELVGIVDDSRWRGVGLKVLAGEEAAIDTTRPKGVRSSASTPRGPPCWPSVRARLSNLDTGRRLLLLWRA